MKEPTEISLGKNERLPFTMHDLRNKLSELEDLEDKLDRTSMNSTEIVK